MSNKSAFEEYLTRKIDDGYSKYHRFLKDKKSPLKLVLEHARTILEDLKDSGVSIERYERFEKSIKDAEEKGMVDGSLEMTYQGAERILEKIMGIVDKKGEEQKRDYSKIFEYIDPAEDPDLFAASVMCLVPEVRARVSNRIDTLYRVVLSAGLGKRRGRSIYFVPRREPVACDGAIPAYLEELISSIPKAETTEDQEYQRMLRVILEKKVEREVFPLFKRNQNAAFSLLERKIEETDNENLRDAYQRLRDVYRGYTDFGAKNANPHFRNPQTGETGVLPSLHQRIALTHFLREKKFGIFDGCGTGKTAIAVLAQPLIEERYKADGKKFRRTIVVCPNTAKKAWKRGLLGGFYERYLEKINPNEVVVVNGDERKDSNFIESLRDKKWIVLNYEQLTAKVNGEKKTFAEALADLGYDYVILDESHHIKSRRVATRSGIPTRSAAARFLANKSEYVCLLSGSPIPDKMQDYCVPYHLLNPRACPDPEKFREQYQENPRLLYTFFNEKTIRRTFEDLNDSVEWEEKDEYVELTPLQRKLYSHIMRERPVNWLIQARKALLDPRLVDPEILQKADLVGRVGIEDSAKYRKLVDILTADDGPIAKGEKFVIFSSSFRQGVMCSDDVLSREHEPLKRRYQEKGLEEEYYKLGLEKSLDAFILESLKKRFGEDFGVGVIDGTVTSVENRERIIDSLNDGLSGILCTTDTGGESLDFTGASYAIFLDEDYSPKTTDQAISRLIRNGQNRKVKIIHLMAEDTMEDILKLYVENKRRIIKIAVDGHPLTKEEVDLLEDTHGKKLVEMIKATLGGTSINSLEARITGIDDFEVKRRIIRPCSRGPTLRTANYDTTDAQIVGERISRERIGCWFDEEFVEFYRKTFPHLSVPVIHRAKICDLVRRAKAGEIDFPEKVLSEGSGSSILYDAYQDLADIIKGEGLAVPVIVDRDFSPLMLERGNNPNKVLGCMTGKDSVFEEGEFDMVDNQSITLLRNDGEVKSCLIEANRILRPRGLLEITLKNLRFSDTFYTGLRRLGFETITKRDEGFFVGRKMFQRLRREKGEAYAESYVDKLSSTYFIIARKVDSPLEVDAKNFKFERIVPAEPDEDDKSCEEEHNNDEGTGRKKGRRKNERKVLPGEIRGLKDEDVGRTTIEE